MNEEISEPVSHVLTIDFDAPSLSDHTVSKLTKLFSKKDMEPFTVINHAPSFAALTGPYDAFLNTNNVFYRRLINCFFDDELEHQLHSFIKREQLPCQLDSPFIKCIIRLLKFKLHDLFCVEAPLMEWNLREYIKDNAAINIGLYKKLNLSQFALDMEHAFSSIDISFFVCDIVSRYSGITEPYLYPLVENALKTRITAEITSPDTLFEHKVCIENENHILRMNDGRKALSINEVFLKLGIANLSFAGAFPQPDQIIFFILALCKEDVYLHPSIGEKLKNQIINIVCKNKTILGSIKLKTM